MKIEVKVFDPRTERETKAWFVEVPDNVRGTELHLILKVHEDRSLMAAPVAYKEDFEIESDEKAVPVREIEYFYTWPKVSTSR